ncbi:hypothetical protein [uncultured Campylobacter sp.]|uniref:hypothetical protein n=1 Tax=uncultured Campylobacter sp. TaxID=218934 RepID=UPI00261A6332|nr:hypothetical protein [uncultured Campylobacter sp.]
MKALKFLTKAIIAALGVCVIVGALNYSGFSFSDLKWLSKDEMVQNFVQDELENYYYEGKSKYNKLYTIDTNLTFHEAISKINEIFENHSNDKDFNLIHDLNSSLPFRDITDEMVSDEKIPWTFSDFIYHHTVNNVDAGDNYTYRPFEGNRKIDYEKEKGKVIILDQHYSSNIYLSDTFTIKECRKETSFIDRILGESQFCMKFIAIKRIPNEYEPSKRYRDDPNFIFNSTKRDFDVFLKNIDSEESCLGIIDCYEARLDNHGSRYIGFMKLFELMK